MFPAWTETERRLTVGRRDRALVCEGGGAVDVRVCVLLHCADEQKPRPAVSEGIKPLNDTKLQGSPSAQRIQRCLRRFNGIAFG